MIRKLRNDFAVSAFALTAAVVTVMAALMCYLNIRSIRSSYDVIFFNHVETVAARLRLDRFANDAWLSELESENGLIIDVNDNGAPLQFGGSYKPATERSTLVLRAVGEAQSAGVSAQSYEPGSEFTSADYTVTGDAGDCYRGRSVIESDGNGYVLLTVLMDSARENREVRNSALTFAAIAVAASLALGAISVVLANRAVRPAADSIKKQSEFIAAASHELRSPLAVIKAGATAAGSSDDVRAFLPILFSETEQMSRLVDDLLTLTRSDAAVWNVRLEPVDIDTLLLEVFEKMAPVANSKGRMLMSELPDSMLPVISSDGIRLTQILVILIGNACEYATAGTDITLGARRKRGMLEIYVSDVGPGIPDKEKEQVFERFYRRDVSRTDKSHFGLGLPVAREYARLISATLTLTDSPQGGSVFSLVLPLSGKTQ